MVIAQKKQCYDIRFWHDILTIASKKHFIMENFTNKLVHFILILNLFMLQSCGVISGIFKAGVWVGVLVVVLVVALIIFLVVKLIKKMG